MGNTIWVQADDPEPASALCPDNSIMLRLENELGALAESLSVPKLTAFYDYSVLQQEYAEEGSFEAEPNESWSDASLMLATVDALRKSLRESLDSLRRQEQLLKELDHCHAVLADAVQRGRKARFLIVP